MVIADCDVFEQFANRDKVLGFAFGKANIRSSNIRLACVDIADMIGLDRAKTSDEAREREEEGDEGADEDE